MLSKIEAEHYSGRYTSQLGKLVETLEQRLLPTFDLISEEADQLQIDAYDFYQTSEETQERIDPLTAYEATQEAAYEHYDMMDNIRQGLLNMFAVALYHLFEQQVRDFHTRVLRRTPLKYASLVLELWNNQIPYVVLSDIETQGINELQSLANTVKHGDGTSADNLYKINPILFRDEWERDIAVDPFVTIHKPEVFTPMFGKEIFVVLDDIHRYQALLCEVWNGYLTAFQRGGKTLE